METTTNQEVKSRKDLMLERLKGKYADKNFDDDEAIYGQIYDDYDDFGKKIAERDSELETLRDRDGKLSALFSGDPRSTAFVQAWRDGEDPLVQLIRRFGPEFEDILHDESKQEAIAEANKEYAERIAKEKEYEEMYQKNLAESVEYLKGLEEQGVPGEELDAAVALAVSIVRDGLLGKFSKETIEMMRKAVNHDADVDEAANEAEVRGRNAKIDEKLRTEKGGDGTSPLAGKNGGTGTQTQRRSMGALDRYDDGVKDIWERGGEKRTKYDY